MAYLREQVKPFAKTTSSTPARENAISLVFRSIIGLLGLLVIFWAFSDPRFRTDEGILRANACLPFALGLAGVLLGLAWRWRPFVYWLCLALVGQAAALQMIDAGPLLHYQHYRPLNQLAQGQLISLVILGFQSTLVLVGLWPRWPAILAWLRSGFKAWQLAGFVVVFILASAALSRDLRVYGSELLLAACIQAIFLSNILLVAWTAPNELVSWSNRLFNGPSAPENAGLFKKSGWPDLAPWLGAAWILLVCAFLSLFIYQNHPHVIDEVSYYYQARYFSQGMLTTPAPQAPKAFALYLIPTQAARWYSVFPPGWGAVLSLGFLIKAPWLVNPLLASINVLLAYFLVVELYDRKLARLVLLLLCVSPWFIFMGMNFMSHTLMLTCVLAAALGIAWARKTGRALWALLSGVCIGLLSLVRPLDGLAMASLLGLWVIGVGGKRLKLTSILAFGLGLGMMASLALPYNRAITGNPLNFPLTDYYRDNFGPKVFALGFGPDRGFNWPIDPLPGYSPLEALINSALNVFSINIELFGWATGSLMFVVLLLFTGRLQKGDYLMLAVIVTIFGLYCLFWYSGGPEFGARYWFLMILPLVVLSARGIQVLMEKVGQASGNVSTGAPRVLLAVLLLCGLTMVNYLPWRAMDKYSNFLNMRPGVLQLAGEYNFGRSLVLVEGREHPDYVSAWTYNPLDPYADQPVYARDDNPAIRAEVLQAYPDRPVWIIKGPSLTGAGYQVVAGPLTSEQALQR